MPENTVTPTPDSTTTPAPADAPAPTAVPVQVQTEVAKVEAEASSVMKSIGNFFSGLWKKALSAEAVVKSWLDNLKSTSAVLVGLAGVGLAAFLELTGTLRVLVIVPKVAEFIGWLGKVIIDGAVLAISGTVSVLQVLLPLIIVGASVYLIVNSLKKK